MIPRSVDSPHYHIWTDALHGRQLAREATNDWNRGTYVRWTVASAWTAFEATCEYLTGAPTLGTRFRERLDEALTAKGFDKPDWGSGLWQQVLNVYGLRKKYVHPAVPQKDLFPPTTEADECVAILRAAIQDMYVRCGASAADWPEDDRDVIDPTGRSMGCLTATRSGATADDGLRISYVTVDGKGHDVEITAPDEDHEALMRDLLRRVIVPVTLVRAHRANVLVAEWKVSMRGGPRRD